MVYWTSLMAGNAAAWQPTMLVPVVVTATFAKTRPVKAPPVKVIDPPTVSPARMFPINVEVVMVAATIGTQYTLQGCPPPAISTEKLVPVSAPATKKVQTALDGPVRVSTPVLAVASRQYSPGARFVAARLPATSVQALDVA